VEETIIEVSKRHSPTGERYVAKPYPKDNQPRTFGVDDDWLEAAANEPHQEHGDRPRPTACQRYLRHSSHAANPAGGSSMGSLPSSSPGVGMLIVAAHSAGSSSDIGQVVCGASAWRWSGCLRCENRPARCRDPRDSTRQRGELRLWTLA
jgi:hypothetical protein